MNYIAIGLVIVWFAGLLFVLGRGMNLSRHVLNNLVPGRDYWDVTDLYRLRARFRIFSTAVSQSDLTETGRRYQEKAVYWDWIMWSWMIGGFFLVVWACSYLKA